MIYFKFIFQKLNENSNFYNYYLFYIYLVFFKDFYFLNLCKFYEKVIQFIHLNIFL
jgi:hypothetical protein